MRITFLVADATELDGSLPPVFAVARELATRHFVTVTSLFRTGDEPFFPSSGVHLEHLVDLREADAPRLCRGNRSDEEARELHARPSVLAPWSWGERFSALADVALPDHLRSTDADVVVTTTGALLAAAVQLVPPGVRVVHHEHRGLPRLQTGREPLVAFGPRADAVVVPTEGQAEWMLGDLWPSVPPPVTTIPDALASGYRPRSSTGSRLIVAAGRLSAEGQWQQVVRAFAQVADRLPEWRLRIFGEGPRRNELLRTVRRASLFDRVELPGTTRAMHVEWATAAVALFSVRTSAYPASALEAMAAGVPVISYDSPFGPRELIEHEHDGLLVPNGWEAGMARSLMTLAEDPGLRLRLGSNALAVRRRHDAGAVAQQWEELLHRILETGRQGDVSPGRHGGERRHPPGAQGPDALPPSAAGLTPGEARARALDVATTAARRAAREWFVIPPHEEQAPVVAMPLTARDAFLAELAELQPPDFLSLLDPGGRGWPPRRASLATLPTELRRGRAPVLHIEPWPGPPDAPNHLSAGGQVVVQFWEEAHDGYLVAPAPNHYTARLPRPVATTPVVVGGAEVPTVPAMVHTTAQQCSFPVDVVYTWVDGADPEWRRRRDGRLAELGGTLPREVSGKARYQNRDELRYSLRSMHLFAPWVRTIHLVTAGQRPDWLLDHPRVRLVDHSAILPPSALPTFSSRSIETALHRVPDLAEHFVYVNDDIFLGRPSRPEQFFSPGGLAAVFAADTPVGLFEEDAPVFLRAAFTNRRLLQDAFGVMTTRQMRHSPHPHRRSVLDEIERRFPEALHRTAHSPFRSETDISLLSSFAQHYGLLTGAAYSGDLEGAFVSLGSSSLQRHLDALLRRDKDYFCIGEHFDHATELSQIDDILRSFLEAYFPVRAPWEAA